MTTAPLARTMGARVGARTVVSLMVGRGAYRLAYQIGNLTLIVLWGTATFSGYAAALGICAWFMYVGVAVEKTALKLLPRSRSLMPRVARVCLALAGIPVLADLLVLATVGPMRPGSTLTLYLVAAAWSTCSGLLLVLAALHRLAGHPERDRRAFVTLALAILASLAATWALRLPPVGQLVLLSAAALVLVVGLARALPAEWRRPPAGRRRGPITRSVLRTTIMLGAYDLCGALCVTIVYAVLTIVGLRAQTSQLYLAALASSTASGGLIYLLRVAQPRVARRQLGAGAASGREQARRMLVLSTAGGVALAVGLAVWAAASGRASRTPGLVALAVVTAAEIVVFTIVVYATFLIENTEAKALRITAGSAMAGLALTALLAVPLVSTFGAAGAIGTLALAAAGQGGVMSLMLSVRYGRSSRGLGTRRYRRAVAEAFATVPYYREWWSEEGLGTPTDASVVERRLEDLVPLRGPSTARAEADLGLRALRRLGVAEVRIEDRHDVRGGLPPSAPAGAVWHDPLLGYVAVRGSCERWHLAVPDFHGRELPDGVALTALRSRTVRLVDIRLDGVEGLEGCPRHRTPVLRPAVGRSAAPRPPASRP